MATWVFSKLPRLQYYFPKNFRCNWKFYESEIFFILLFAFSLKNSLTWGVKREKKNAICFKLFWYKIFVHWKSKLLSVLVDYILNSLYDLVSDNMVTINVIFLIVRWRSLQEKIQLLQVNDLFDKDFKSYTVFLDVIYPKKCLIFVVQ